METFKEFLKRMGIGIKEFIKASLISSLISFVVLLIGLGIGDVAYYGLIAFFISIVDLLPVLGSGIILIPWSVIALISGNTRLSVILIIIFILTFLIDQIVEPMILGKSIGLKPIFTFLITGLSMLILTPAIGAIVGSIISIIISVIIDMNKAREENNIKS